MTIGVSAGGLTMDEMRACRKNGPQRPRYKSVIKALRLCLAELILKDVLPEFSERRRRRTIRFCEDVVRRHDEVVKTMKEALSTTSPDWLTGTGKEGART